MRLSLDAIVRAVRGNILAPVGGLNSLAGEMTFEHISTDSRALSPGALFVCIRGETFDGHNFAEQAAQAGAAVILAERNPFACPPPVPVILTTNSVIALGLLAHEMRKKLQHTRVVGITGTSGKTTIKELLAQVLGRVGLTAKNPLNQNNQIGLPLSMLAANGEEAYWVMEAGISHPEDMDELGTVLEPDLGIILNVGPGHIAGLGDRGTAYYKSRFLAHLAPGGRALLSADYPELVREALLVCREATFFSAQGRQVEYRSAYAGSTDDGSGLYRLWLKGTILEVKAPFRGGFGAENVIAVAAAAHQLGVPPVEIAEGLAEGQLPKQRFACTHVGQWLMIDDSYNANPLSFNRMLEAAAHMATEGSGQPFVCVGGEMGELGNLTAEAHVALGRQLAAIRPQLILWKGKYHEKVVSGLQEGKYTGRFFPVTAPNEMLDALATENLSGGVILFKGSRFNKLEQFVKVFADAQAGDTHAL